jgi:hypothetical protein
MSGGYYIDDNFVSEFNRIKRKIDTLAGDSVTNSRDSITIGRQHNPPQAAVQPVPMRVKIFINYGEAPSVTTDGFQNPYVVTIAIPSTSTAGLFVPSGGTPPNNCYNLREYNFPAYYGVTNTADLMLPVGYTVGPAPSNGSNGAVYSMEIYNMGSVSGTVGIFDAANQIINHDCL